ncbi:GAP family protein [Arthrobacter sp. HLT1-20]
MYEVIGTLIPLGLGISLSPFPIIMIVLLLGSTHPKANGLAFLLGWVAGIAVIVAALTLLLDTVESSGNGDPNAVAGILRLALGAGLLFLAGRKFAKRIKQSGAGSLPRWMASAETMAPSRSLLTGLALSAANPKNLMITAAAGVTIGAASLSVTQELWAMAAFLVVCSVTVVLPVTGYLVAPEKMAVPLASLMGWLRTNHSIMTGLLLLVFGFILIGNGIGSFQA